MSKVISILSVDKVKQSLDGSEFTYKNSFIVGTSKQTPKGKISTIDRIREDYYNEWLTYIVEFDNGESFQVFPVPPFDIGYETLKEEEDETD